MSIWTAAGDKGSCDDAKGIDLSSLLFLMPIVSAIVLFADVTAKGESVANLADIGGSVTGILLSRSKFKMLPTFCLLSAGYLLASRQEVATVQLPYLNRARLAFAARTFLATGTVPGPALSNEKEPLLPWGPYGQAMTPSCCC